MELSNFPKIVIVRNLRMPHYDKRSNKKIMREFEEKSLKTNFLERAFFWCNKNVLQLI